MLSAHFYFRGAHDQAITTAQRAVALATAGGDAVLQALANRYLGFAYQAQGDYRRVIECYMQTVTAIEGALHHQSCGHTAPCRRADQVLERYLLPSREIDTAPAARRHAGDRTADVCRALGDGPASVHGHVIPRGHPEARGFTVPRRRGVAERHHLSGGGVFAGHGVGGETDDPPLQGLSGDLDFIRADVAGTPKRLRTRLPALVAKEGRAAALVAPGDGIDGRAAGQQGVSEGGAAVGVARGIAVDGALSQSQCGPVGVVEVAAGVVRGMVVDGAPG